MATAPEAPPSRASWQWLRVTLIAGIALGSFASALAIAYELALSRVPQHRAALESLVRSQTGLDIRFNELSLRWGWYGPEAVLNRVELGEPGKSNVLLRAPQLIVAINAWQTARAGRLVSGRITLIAADIDLERLVRQTPPELPSGSAPTPGATQVGSARSRVLDRWKGGVVDLQGGTLRLPDPTGSGSALTLQIRRAAVRRAGDEWSGHALVFLPERLGRTARVVAQVTGDITSFDTLSGGVRFEGVRLAFASWRNVLDDFPKLAGNLPLGGSGDVTVDLTLKHGVVSKSEGQVRATDVSIGTPAWLNPLQASHSALKLDYLAGDWKFLRRANASQLQIEQLVLSREQRESPLPAFSIEMAAGHLHSSLESAPLQSLATVARWLAPELAPDSVALEGSVEKLDVDWNPRRPEGQRLAASATVDQTLVTSVTHGFALKGLPVRLHATESRVGIEIDAPEAHLKLAADPDWPAYTTKLVSRMAITREGEGWRMTIPRFSFADETLSGEVFGALTAEAAGAVPIYDIRGNINHADVLRAQALFEQGVSRVLGPTGMRISAGRIENGTFEVKGPVDGKSISDATRFVGGFDLKGARIPADDIWPETQALDARVEWNGPRARASVAEGKAGAFELESVEAQWDASGERPSRFTGRAHGKLEQALAWVREHPELQQHAPHLQELVAKGDALFDFDVTVPEATSVTSPAAPRVKARVSTVLEGVQFTLAPDLPPVESLRGALTYDGGRLQRSTLSATWLGGPLTLRLAERRDRRGSSLAVQAQGFVDARKLVALSEFRDLAEVSGETAWSGDFVYTPPSGATPARWQGRADSSLLGVSSDFPAPLAKNAGVALPLHIEITGVGNQSELRANLADRARAAFALNVIDQEDWHIDRGAIRLGSGPVTLPADEVIQVRGRLKRLDAPAYVLAWQQLTKGSPDTRADIDISADELVLGERVYDDAIVQASAAVNGAPANSTALRIEADSLGVLTGTLVPDARQIVFNDLRIRKGALTGTGTLRCAANLVSCHSEFELDTADAEAALVDLGFRPDLSAAKGSLSGEIAWEPRREGPWLESATGTLSMRFEDGTAHAPGDKPGRPLALLTVPALLGGITDARVVSEARSGGVTPAASAVMPSGDLKFTRLEARFQLRDGQATTSDLHFDGDAEIIVRGRTGLLTHDYDHEAWILRGGDRIPASVRRLPSAPRVAAAWLSLRELIGGDATNRSRIVLRLRGSWSEPTVTAE